MYAVIAVCNSLNMCGRSRYTAAWCSTATFRTSCTWQMKLFKHGIAEVYGARRKKADRNKSVGWTVTETGGGLTETPVTGRCRLLRGTAVVLSYVTIEGIQENEDHFNTGYK